MKSINLIILFLMAVLPTYARGNLHNLQQQQDKKKSDCRDAHIAPRKLQDFQQLRKAGDAAEVGMFKLLYLFVRPGSMKRDMDGRGSDF